MNLQLLNPYQIIKSLKEENEQLKKRIEELEKEGVVDDSVVGNSDGQVTE